MYKILSVTDQCAEIFKKADYAVLGISPFNSYYTREVITDLINVVSSHFIQWKIFIPDEITKFTLQAMGYTKKNAEIKSNKQIRYLKNKVYSSLKTIFKDESIIDNKIIGMKDLNNNLIYLDRYNLMLDFFNSNDEFRSFCLEFGGEALKGVRGNYHKLVSEAEKLLASQYLLAELPLFCYLPEIFQMPTACFIYHKIPPFIVSFYNDYRARFVSSFQAFLAIEESSHAFNNFLASAV